eukprot:14969002-Alexandrium_andersonii.AAC.1
MSASLVGSEMCIRDRLEAVPGSVGQFRAVSGSFGRIRAASCSFGPNTNCLLYTSDAADDM